METKKKNIFLAILGVGILIIGLTAGINLVKQQQDLREKALVGGPSFYFEPPQLQVSSPSTGNTYDIYMNTNGYSVTAASIEVGFNSSQIQVSAISEGTALPVKLGSSIGATTAKIDVGAQPSSPFSGTGKVATITFNAAEVNAESIISFTSNTQVAAAGQTGNVLGNTTSGVVLIGSSGGSGGASLFFQPSSKSVGANSTNQTYDIYLDTKGLPVTAALIEVAFDSSLVQATAISEGTALPVKLASSISPGLVKIELGAQPSTPFTGNGKVAILTFSTGNTGGTASLSFTTNSQVAASNQSGNVLSSTTSGSVTVISAASTVTPTPTTPSGGGTPPPIGGSGDMIDNFEGYKNSTEIRSYWTRDLSGNNASASLNSTYKSEGGYGMGFFYNVGSPDDAGLLKSINMDWTGKETINLWLKPDGSNRTFAIRFKEASGEYWETYYVMSSAIDTILNLPIKNFVHPQWYINSGKPGSNGVKDLSSISEISVHVNQGMGSAGSNTIFVDNIYLTTGITTSDGVIKIVPGTASKSVGEVFSTDIRINTAGYTISSIAFRLSYPYSTGTAPVFDVVTSSGTSATQITPDSALVSSNTWSFPVNKVTKSDGNVNIDFSAVNTSVAGFSSQIDTTIARIYFKASSFPSPSMVSLSFNSSETIMFTKTKPIQNILGTRTGASYTIIQASPTLTSTPTITPTPTNTPTPTDIISTLDYGIKMQGVSTASFQRTVNLSLFNSSNNKVYSGLLTSDTDAVFRTTSPIVLNGLTLTSAATTFSAKAKAEGYLAKNIDTINLVIGSNKAPSTWDDITLKAGDFDGNNILNIMDIGTILAEYNALSVPVSANNKKFDIDGNGILNIQDIGFTLTNFTDLQLYGD